MGGVSPADWMDLAFHFIVPRTACQGKGTIFHPRRAVSGGWAGKQAPGRIPGRPGRSLSEVGADGLHPLALGHMEGTAAVAVAAGKAVRGGPLQGQVVLPGQLVPQAGQVVVLIDEGDVQARRAGVAVLAVDAAASALRRGELAETGVVPLLRRGVEVLEGPPAFPFRPQSPGGP